MREVYRSNPCCTIDPYNQTLLMSKESLEWKTITMFIYQEKGWKELWEWGLFSIGASCLEIRMLEQPSLDIWKAKEYRSTTSFIMWSETQDLQNLQFWQVGDVSRQLTRQSLSCQRSAVENSQLISKLGEGRKGEA
jgi:hypothetical protein